MLCSKHLCVGGIFVRLLLEGPAAAASASAGVMERLPAPRDFFMAAHHRLLCLGDTNLLPLAGSGGGGVVGGGGAAGDAGEAEAQRELCVRAMAAAYRSHAGAIGPVDGIPHLLALFDATPNRAMRCARREVLIDATAAGRFPACAHISTPYFLHSCLSVAGNSCCCCLRLSWPQSHFLLLRRRPPWMALPLPPVPSTPRRGRPTPTVSPCWRPGACRYLWMCWQVGQSRLLEILLVQTDCKPSQHLQATDLRDPLAPPPSTAAAAHEASERPLAALQTNLIASSSHAKDSAEWYCYPTAAQQQQLLSSGGGDGTGLRISEGRMGPVSRAEIRQLHSSGAVDGGTSFWTAGMAEPLPLGSLRELRWWVARKTGERCLSPPSKTWIPRLKKFHVDWAPDVSLHAVSSAPPLQAR